MFSGSGVEFYFKPSGHEVIVDGVLHGKKGNKMTLGFEIAKKKVLADQIVGF